MTAREELVATVRRQLARKDSVARAARSTVIADALLAEGWRKIPSREAISRMLFPNTFDTGRPDHRAFRSEGLLMAETILALMEGADDE